MISTDRFQMQCSRHPMRGIASQRSRLCLTLHLTQSTADQPLEKKKGFHSQRVSRFIAALNYHSTKKEEMKFSQAFSPKRNLDLPRDGKSNWARRFGLGPGPGSGEGILSGCCPTCRVSGPHTKIESLIGRSQPEWRPEWASRASGSGQNSKTRQTNRKVAPAR